MIRRWAVGGALVAGIVTGSRCGFGPEGPCAPMTLEAIPLGTFEVDGTEGAGTLEITEEHVHLQLLESEATWRRVGETTTGG